MLWQARNLSIRHPVKRHNSPFWQWAADAIPNSRRTYLGEKTIEAWLYKYRREGIAGLAPKTRIDRGRSKIAPALQEAIVAAKCDNPRGSIRQIRQLLASSGQVAKGSLSRSAIRRLMAGHGIARMSGSFMSEEKLSFVAEWAAAIWYGDVMHGPRVMAGGKLRKAYLVSLFDDASRLVTHSAFCLGETALDIEGVLKPALLKRGRPIKLVVDNGAPTAPARCKRCARGSTSTSSTAGRTSRPARARSNAGTARCATSSLANWTTAVSGRAQQVSARSGECERRYATRLRRHNGAQRNLYDPEQPWNYPHEPF